VAEVGAGLVISDDELSASQARVLEGDAGAPVVDRTELIIEIFAAHAGDAASRLEVELAGLQYRLPRVKGRTGGALSRLGGGGGGGGGARRGSGEQQLEYDRRRIRERIETIRARLAEEGSARGVRRARLARSGVPKVALVGYTNAGKTTILNALSGERRSAADRLFETLETTTRVVSGDGRAGGNGGAGPAEVEAGADFVVTDTVGFIRKLPAQLVHSFASTLEAAVEADVLVVCADASSPSLDEEIRTAEETLSEALAMASSPRASSGGAASRNGGAPDQRFGGGGILCLNKADLLTDRERAELARSYPGAVIISARRDVSPLLGAIRAEIGARGVRMEVLIPHSEYAAATRLYGLAEIHSRSDTEEGLLLDVTLPKSRAPVYYRYRTTAS
jgi:GTP-binding protein HflX